MSQYDYTALPSQDRVTYTYAAPAPRSSNVGTILAVFCCICCCSMIAIGIAAGIAIYVLFPKQPNVSTKVYDTNISIDSTIPLIKFTFSLNVTVNNPNVYSLGVSDLNVKVYYWTPTQLKDNGGSIPTDGSKLGSYIGDAEYLPVLTFPGKQVTTQGPIKLTLRAVALDKTKVYQGILDDCSISSRKELNLQMVGNFSGHVQGVKIPITIPIRENTKVGCSSSSIV
ncbi:apeA [Acrasis kona]|uniref:ApeA n=1 Tax=Acrasis kona TaxID=1008807 RepID=A0AAW2ZPN6_9EUKA